jgi:hypothetical protein
MIIAKRLKGKAIAAWLGPTGDAARRVADRVRQKISSAPRKLELYFDITDPWSYLAAQAVARLVQAYPVELEFHTVTPPASDVDPAPTLRPACRARRSTSPSTGTSTFRKKELDPNIVRDFRWFMRPAADQLRAATSARRAWQFTRIARDADRGR